MRRLILAAALALVACGGDSGPARVEAEGSWSGPVRDNSGTLLATMSLTLSETSGTVTGTGNLSGGTAVAITATGTYTPPNLSLNLTAPGFNNLNLSATVGETTMTGTLNGSGFVNSGITLTRQ